MGALQSRRSRDPKNKPRTSLHRPYVANASVASNQRHSQVTETDSLSKQEGRRERESECEVGTALQRKARHGTSADEFRTPGWERGRHHETSCVPVFATVQHATVVLYMGVRRRPGKQQSKTNSEPQQQTVCREHCDEIDEVATT